MGMWGGENEKAQNLGKKGHLINSKGPPKQLVGCDMGMYVCLFFEIVIILLGLAPMNEDSINSPYRTYFFLLLILEFQVQTGLYIYIHIGIIYGKYRHVASGT